MTDVTEAKAVTWCATSSLSIIKPTVFCGCRRRRVCPKLALQDFAHICASKPDGPQVDVRMILHGASAVRCSLAQFRVTYARSGIVSPRLPLKETQRRCDGRWHPSFSPGGSPHISSFRRGHITWRSVVGCPLCSQVVSVSSSATF